MRSESLMTIEEVACYLRVKKRTIYDWVKNGKIPAIKAVGQWRFKKDLLDVIAVIKKNWGNKFEMNGGSYLG